LLPGSGVERPYLVLGQQTHRLLLPARHGVEDASPELFVRLGWVESAVQQHLGQKQKAPALSQLADRYPELSVHLIL